MWNSRRKDGSLVGQVVRSQVPQRLDETSSQYSETQRNGNTMEQAIKGVSFCFIYLFECQMVCVRQILPAFLPHSHTSILKNILLK